MPDPSGSHRVAENPPPFFIANTNKVAVPVISTFVLVGLGIIIHSLNITKIHLSWKWSEYGEGQYFAIPSVTNKKLRWTFNDAKKQTSITKSTVSGLQEVTV